MRRHLPAALAIATLTLTATAACGSDEPTTPAPPPTTQQAAPTTPTAKAPRIADLITTLGCKGNVIGTQLYSRETGRCTLGAGEITIAAFDTNALRDQWVDAGRQLGGSIVQGEQWAAWATNPDDATTAAQKLGGTVL